VTLVCRWRQRSPGHNATRHPRIYPAFPDSLEWAHTTSVPTHSGFEQERNDYERLERRWPASTGWLIASILLAHKLWIMDVTSISLYWVARLPVERPKEQTSRISPMRRPERPVFVLVARNGGRRRQWKIALSLAIVGAVAAPFVFRTYKARPTYSVWLPLTAREKENFAVSLQNSNYCRRKTDNDVIEFLCYKAKEKFEQGGDYEYHPDHPKYLAMNVGVAAATFVSVFGLAFLIPMLIHGLAFLARRYWKWLNA
jgi:hypothetical protein